MQWKSWINFAFAFFLALNVPNQVLAQSQKPVAGEMDLEILEGPESEMRRVMDWYKADLGSLLRFYNIAISENRHARLDEFYAKWQQVLGRINFGSLSPDGQLDYLLFQNYLRQQQRHLDLEKKNASEMTFLIPFAKTLIELEEARQRMEKIDPRQVAERLTNLKKEVEQTRKKLESIFKDKKKDNRLSASVAYRAAESLDRLRYHFKHWYGFYKGYDPLFTWWNEEPYKSVDGDLHKYAVFLREKIVGIKAEDKNAIVGDPIGREGLLKALQSELIPYSPEELVVLAEKEMAWCHAEWLKATKALGYHEDWRKALEHVKQKHVEPGKQPELIRMLAAEAVAFLKKHDLVTVPELARTSWRMEMMSPERQLVNPYFLGGEAIIVSYPTDSMTHEQKLMSMRGNNLHFCRATVHHELIPGHHLQQFMTARYRPHRKLFNTPFWVEGWALYWEMLLYDMGFPKTPEDRIGMLFWRKHRCARIIFSLNFHLGKWTPQQCIDYLVDNVGHERNNATAEVRRSFAGNYSPLYQAAYMLGGLQIRQLRKELVESGKMTNRQFHDAILKENSIPIAFLRARLLNHKLTRDHDPQWRFYGEIKGKRAEKK